MSGLGGGATFARLVPIALERPLVQAVSVRVGWRRRRLSLELRMTPWWPRDPSLTLVELLPKTHVEPTQAYFDAGNRLLDELLEDQVRPVQACPRLTRPPVRSTELA